MVALRPDIVQTAANSANGSIQRKLQVPGQSMWGGWTDEGVQHFTQLRNQVNEGHDQDHVKQMEEEFLLCIRKQNNLVDEDEKKLKKLAKSKAINQHEERPIDPDDA